MGIKNETTFAWSYSTCQYFDCFYVTLEVLGLNRCIEVRKEVSRISFGHWLLKTDGV